MKQRLSVALVIVMLLAALIPTAFTNLLSADYRLMGDVNNDGVVNIKDILQMREVIFGIRELYDDDYFTSADLNFDGKISIEDILIVRDIIFGEEPPPWPLSETPQTEEPTPEPPIEEVPISFWPLAEDFEPGEVESRVDDIGGGNTTGKYSCGLNIYKDCATLSFSYLAGSPCYEARLETVIRKGDTLFVNIAIAPTGLSCAQVLTTIFAQAEVSKDDVVGITSIVANVKTVQP